MVLRLGIFFLSALSRTVYRTQCTIETIVYTVPGTVNRVFPTVSFIYLMLFEALEGLSLIFVPF